MNVDRRSFRMAIAVAVLAVVGGMTACTTDDNDPGASGSGGTSGGLDGGMGGKLGGGGSGGGAPAGTACASPIVVPAARPGIADFDGYDGVTSVRTWSAPLGGDSASNQYVGPFGYGDRADGFPETFEMTTGHESMYAPRIADSLAQAYGGGMGTWLSACLNATAFQGISFWVRGNTPSGTSALALTMQETLPSTPAKAGDAIGICAGDATTCVHPKFAFAVTDTWTKVQAPWASFMPGNAAGTSVTPNGRNINQLQWSADLIWKPDAAGVYMPVAAPYELVVDTIAFY